MANGQSLNSEQIIALSSLGFKESSLTSASTHLGRWGILGSITGGNGDVTCSAKGAIPRPSLHSEGEPREQANHTSVSGPITYS